MKHKFHLQLFNDVPFDTAGESAQSGTLVPNGGVGAGGTSPQDVPASGAGAAGTESAAESAAPQNPFLPHIENMHREGERLRAVFPNFDLRRELSDPVFRKLTSPAVGISVEDAYYTVHRKELESFAMQRAAKDAAEKTAAAVRAGQKRPIENGAAAQGASITAFDYRSATREQRNALKKRIFDAGARGEKIFPGY